MGGKKKERKTGRQVCERHECTGSMRKPLTYSLIKKRQNNIQTEKIKHLDSPVTEQRTEFECTSTPTCKDCYVVSEFVHDEVRIFRHSVWAGVRIDPFPNLRKMVFYPVVLCQIIIQTRSEQKKKKQQQKNSS